MKASLRITTVILAQLLVLGLVTSQAEAVVNRKPCLNPGDASGKNANYVAELDRYLLADSEKLGFTSQCQLLRKNPNYGSRGYYNNQEWLPTGDAYLTDNSHALNQVNRKFTVTAAAHELAFDMSVYGKKEKNYNPINFKEPIKINCNGIILNATIDEEMTPKNLVGQYTARNDFAFMDLDTTESNKLENYISSKTIKPMRFAGLPTKMDKVTGDIKYDKIEIDKFLQKYDLALVSRANQANDPTDSRLFVTKCSKKPDVDYGGETVFFNCAPRKDMSGGALIFTKKSTSGVGEFLKDKDGHILVAGHMSKGSDINKTSQLVLMGIDDVRDAMSSLQVASATE